jgi:hypothetical protein
VKNKNINFQSFSTFQEQTRLNSINKHLELQLKQVAKEDSLSSESDCEYLSCEESEDTLPKQTASSPNQPIKTESQQAAALGHVDWIDTHSLVQKVACLLRKHDITQRKLAADLGIGEKALSQMLRFVRPWRKCQAKTQEALRALNHWAISKEQNFS